MLSGILLVCLWLAVLLFAMAESALLFASRTKLEEGLEEPGRRDRYLRYLGRSAPARPFSVVARVGAVCALLGLLGYDAAGRSLPAGVMELAAGGGAVAAAELMGRWVGRTFSTPVLIVLLPPLQAAWLLGWPVRALWPRREEGAPPQRDEPIVDAAIEEIRVAIEDATTEGALHSDERDMIEGVLEFEDVEVHEIMSPRTEIECVEAGLGLEAAVGRVTELHHHRIPVFEQVRDKVVGILYVKDLLAEVRKPPGEQRGLRELMKKPFFVPETKRAVGLLREFQQRHLQIAIILDEYGGVTGLVTLEDVMEQIVGELEEGYGIEGIEDRVRPLGEGALDVDARLHVDEVNDLLSIALPEDEDYDTVGGFMMAQFASVPRTGEQLDYNGARLRVLESDDRRVLRVLVQRLPENAETKSGS